MVAWFVLICGSPIRNLIAPSSGGPGAEDTSAPTEGVSCPSLPPYDGVSETSAKVTSLVETLFRVKQIQNIWVVCFYIKWLFFENNHFPTISQKNQIYYDDAVMISHPSSSKLSRDLTDCCKLVLILLPSSLHSAPCDKTCWQSFHITSIRYLTWQTQQIYFWRSTANRRSVLLCNSTLSLLKKLFAFKS